MEVFLLLVDEIDDALGALRHLLPKLLSLAAAVLLFAATGFVLLRVSYTVAGVIGGVAFCGLIIAFERVLHAPVKGRDRTTQSINTTTRPAGPQKV